MSSSSDSRPFQAITCLIRLAEAFEKSGDLTAKIDWQAFFGSIEELVHHQAPALSTPCAKATDLRPRIEGWLQRQVGWLSHLPVGWEYKRISKEEMGPWHSRVAKAGNSNEQDQNCDRVGLALHYFDEAWKVLDRPHHDGWSYAPLQGGPGERLLGTLIHKMCRFAALLGGTVPESLRRYMDEVQSPQREGRFVVLGFEAFGEQDNVASGGPTFVALQERTGWIGSCELSANCPSAVPLREHLRVGDELYISNLESVSVGLVTVASSTVVLHPDWLVAVTDVSECYEGYVKEYHPEPPADPMRVLCKLFSPRGVTRPSTLVGNIGHSVLDRILQRRNNDIGTTVDQVRAELLPDAFGDYLLEMASLGGVNFAAKLRNLREDATDQRGYKVLGYDALIRNILAILDQTQGFAFWEVPVVNVNLGLTGKIDALIEKESPGQYQYVDLKTGTFYPRTTLNPQYRTQLQLYRLLSNPRFRSAQTNPLQIWAPRAEGREIQFVPEVSDPAFQQIVRVRNDLVRRIEAMVDPMTVWTTICAVADGQDLWYHKKGQDNADRLALCRALSTSIELEKSYAGFIVAFAVRTLLSRAMGKFSTTGSRSYSDIWKRSVKDKTVDGEILSKLTLVCVEEQETGYRLTLRDPIGEHDVKFREGDYLVLYPHQLDDELSTPSWVVGARLVALEPIDSGNSEPRIVPPLRVVLEVSANVPELHSWKLALDAAQSPKGKRKLDPELKSSNEIPLFCLERDFQEHLSKDSFKGVSHFLTRMSDSGKKVLLGAQKPGEVLAESAGKTAEERYSAVVEAASCAEPLFLVQGTPGSGKTKKCIPDIVRRCLELRPTEKIIIVAMSNQAVWEIASGLHESGSHGVVDFLQFGEAAPDRFAWSREHSWQRLVGGSDHASAKDASSAGVRLSELHDRIRKAPIVVSTLASAREKLLLACAPTTLIIDEASQLHECQLLTTMSFTRRWIIIGDQKQLPPVHEIEADEGVMPESLHALGFAVPAPEGKQVRPGASIMERLWRLAGHRKWKGVTATLEKQYRMHDEVLEFVKTNYCGVDLSGAEPRQTEGFSLHGHSDWAECAELVAERSYVEALRQHRTFRIGVSGTDPVDQRRKENDIVLQLLLLLHRQNITYERNGRPPITIGVVMPFRVQNQNLKATLAASFATKGWNGWERYRIDTVERFQGGQADVIILSTGIHGISQLATLQALMPEDPEVNEPEVDCKLNVAWSRAREQAILIGNERALGGSPHYRRLLQMLTPVVPGRSDAMAGGKGSSDEIPTF